MLGKKEKKEVVLPPLHLRRQILDTYYQNLKKMDRIDAHIAYDTAMHILYCKYNPHLRYSGYDKDGNPKPRKILTREDFLPKHDRFGFPMWVHDLNEEELNSHLPYHQILKLRKIRKNNK